LEIGLKNLDFLTAIFGDGLLISVSISIIEKLFFQKIKVHRRLILFLKNNFPHTEFSSMKTNALSVV